MLNFADFLDSSISKIDPMIRPHWEIDHVCFRTESLEEYGYLKNQYSTWSQLLIESEVGGRPIATFKLDNATSVGNHLVDLIELPAPKEGKKVKNGLEHFEVVIDKTFQSLMNDYPDIAWNTSALSKDLNPELQASFEGFNVKFHYHSLEQIINIEKNISVSKFLDESQILSKLKAYRPLISGTIPLGIDTNESDLDILFQADNFKEFLDIVKDIFPMAKNRIETDYSLSSFRFKGLNVELFCQKLHPIEQSAHRHLRTEARLLKLLGLKFKQKIIELKEAGVKTEPAFGEVLGLSDPYSDLLTLGKFSDVQLLERFSQIRDSL